MTALPFLRPLLLLLCLLMRPAGAGPQYASTPLHEAQPVYRLAVHPLYNPAKLAETYQPLIDYLNRHIQGARFELEASRDYQMYEAKLRARQPQLLLPNPWQTLLAIGHGYTVIAMAGDAADFRGLFIVRKDSGIVSPGDLKGKAVAYPSPTALAACIMAQAFLHERNLDVMHDIDNRYVGSQESAIMNAYLGQTAAGVTWPPPWRLFQRDHPREAAQLKVIWETGTLVNNSVMLRNDTPAEIRNQLQRALLELDRTPEGRAILATAQTRRFHPASNADYDVVRGYIAHFEREIRPVERK
ncbi:MAG: phosphate/phosphite/phosphonate ABC transporter substrate-binding protein [Chitinivorax sp.]